MIKKHHTDARSPEARKPLLLIDALLVLPFVLTGCNTITGLGEDVEAAGDAIEKKATENKTY